MQYGFAIDPLKPEKCMLSLGHNNFMWRFDYLTGEIGCGTTNVSTPLIDQLYCNGAPDSSKFQWSSVNVATANAAGTLTIKQSSTTATLTLVSSTTNYAMPSSIAPGFGPLTFSFVPSSGSPSAVDLVVGYTSDKNPEICYQAKISKCGPVFNDAVFKGSLNGAAINVAQKVDLGKADGPECAPPPPPVVTCLSGDAKVTCGEKPGTYVITLATSGAGGLAPDHVSITPTTPGVTIVGPQSSYAVIGGLVKITIAGVSPGDVITFDMQGTKAGAGAVEGSDLCCNGTVKVTIPKDLPCEKPDISILKTGPKTCEPGKPCTFNVTVTNNGGPFNGNVLLWDAVTPNAWAVTSITPNVCGASISTTPFGCVANLNLAAGQSMTFAVTMTAAFNDGKPAENCISAAFAPSWLTPKKAYTKAELAALFAKYGAVKPIGKSCWPVQPPVKSTVDVSKTCDPAVYRKYALGPAIDAIGWVTMCHIKVTTTGPQTGTLSVNDSLTGGGTIISANSTTTPAWICAAASCSVNGALLNQTSSVSNIDVFVTFPSAGHVTESRNCASIAVNKKDVSKDCTKFTVEEPTVSVTKVCEPAKYVWIGDLPPKPNMPPNGYLAICHIKVSTTGIISNPISVSEALNGSGTVTYLSATDPWVCAPLSVPGGTPMNCTLPGNVMTAPSDTSVIDVKVTFTSAGAVNEAKNCASATYGGKPSKKSCDDFEIDKGTISVEKKCAPAIFGKYPVGPAATGFGLHADCQIIVKTTGPQSSIITVGDALVGTGNVVNMNAPAPWTCTTPACSVNGSALNQTSSTTVISAIVTFANAGDAMEAKNCAKVDVAGTPAGESCTKIEAPKLGSLTVTKEAAYNGSHVLNVNFPIAVTCGSSTTNATVADSVPYVQSNIPLGTNCSVVEGTAPVTGLCPRGQLEIWTTTYAPATPVTVTAGGATIKVLNVLTCKPAKGTLEIRKVCEPATEIIGPVKGQYASKCQIIVTTTGPQTGNISVGENLTGGGTLGAASAPAPWTCSGANCSVSGTALNQTSSMSVIDVVVTFPSAGHALESKNCAAAAVDKKDVAKDCTTFTVVPPKDTGKITVLKVALYNGNHITNQAFPITVTCGSITANGSVSDGAPYVQTGLPLNAACSVVEGATTPAPGLCKKGQTASWLTTYAPSTPVAASAAGGTITIKNQLVCKPADPKGLNVTKLVINHASGSVAGLVFPYQTTCTNSPNTAGLGALTDGQTQPTWIYVANTSCTVAEGAIPATSACGKGMNPVWSTVYLPSQTVPLVPAGETVTIQNTLDCEPVNPPVDSSLYVKKVVVNNAPGSVAGMVFTLGDTCTNDPTTTGIHNISDGQTQQSHLYVAGTSCKITEYPIPATSACGKLTPVWTTTYSPSQTVVLSPSGETVTVTNTLNCEPVKGDGLSTFSVHKEASYNGEAITNVSFPMTVTCGEGNVQSISVTAGQSQTISNLSDGTICTVVEGTIAHTGLCPKGSIEEWSASYEPANASNTTSSLSSVIVTVRNVLTCKSVIIDNPLKCDPATATQAGDLCRCRFDNMQQVSKTACECKAGFTLKPGKGCVPKVIEPKCDPATTVTKGGKCVCEYKGMVQTSATACACAKGLKFAPGKGCYKPEPVCKNGERYQPKRDRCEPVCERGFNYIVKRNLCIKADPVCGRNQVLLRGRCTDKAPVCGRNQDLVKGRCVNKAPFCRPPFKYDAKRRACVEQIQRCEPGQIRVRGKCIRVPKCGFGEIPIPGTGICVSIGGGGGGDGGPKGDNGCVPTPGRVCK